MTKNCWQAFPLKREGSDLWLAREVDDQHTWHAVISDRLRFVQQRTSSQANIDYHGRITAECHRMKFTGIPDDAFGDHDPMDDD